MGSRERKRAERRKRKRRSVERIEEVPAGGPEPESPPEAVQRPVGEESAESFQERMARRSEARNAEVRAGLEPLAEGERPTAVTVAAVVSALLSVAITVSAVLAAAGVEVDGDEVNPAPLVIFAAALWLMTWGLWRARYWAVLGFQMLLVLFMLASAAGLVGAPTILLAAGAVVQLLASGVLFYFMIRAMARIQMPELPGDR
jgi:hypothetical protein